MVLTKHGGFKIIMVGDRNNKERKKMKTMIKGFLGKKIVFYLKDIALPRIFEGQQILRTSITSQVGGNQLNFL